MQVPAVHPPSQQHLFPLCLHQSQWTATPLCQLHPMASQPLKPCTPTGFMPTKVQPLQPQQRALNLEEMKSTKCFLERTDVPQIALSISLCVNQLVTVCLLCHSSEPCPGPPAAGLYRHAALYRWVQVSVFAVRCVPYKAINWHLLLFWVVGDKYINFLWNLTTVHLRFWL